MLAGPGVVAATYATGALANWLLMPTADGRYFNSSSTGGGSVDIVGLPGEALADGCAADAWTEMAGYVLGVIVSATDPVAVVALLKELGVKAELSIGGAAAKRMQQLGDSMDMYLLTGTCSSGPVPVV